MLSSTGRAAEYVGNRLGEFQRAGEFGDRGYWKQREGEHYLFYDEGRWYVSDRLGTSIWFGQLVRNPGDSDEPPKTGWEHYDGSEWAIDPSLTVSCGPLEPCARVTVAMAGAAARVKGSFQGAYVPTDTWSAGRPVYRAEGGRRWYLRVGEGTVVWIITDTLNATDAVIQSGRLTNSPGDGAGGSERFGTTRWRYADGGEWPEGDITVSC